MMYNIYGTIGFDVDVFGAMVTMEQDFAEVFDVSDIDNDFNKLPEDEQKQLIIDYIQEENEDLPALLDIWIDGIEPAED